ncbi:nucleoside 2-deoxyribosyltransferase domain-containing protein [Enterobacter asburiae]|uniref:nucleoside 2-deoxyribosyltransferase domain-containing protein n=1 Tax=Enterobacter asburiae TaxID=61645 RepID=UPI002FD57F28
MKLNNQKKVIYLAGGFKSQWQLIVHEALNDFVLKDPSQHHIDDPVQYTQWDLNAIENADILLANMESSNPGGYALALEVGYAKALGKQVIFVDQIENETIKQYFEMVRQCSDHVFESLDDALDFILNHC